MTRQPSKFESQKTKKKASGIASQSQFWSESRVEVRTALFRDVSYYVVI